MPGYARGCKDTRKEVAVSLHHTQESHSGHHGGQQAPSPACSSPQPESTF